MHSLSKQAVCAAFAAILASAAIAQDDLSDFPTVGLLYNQQEDSSITYDCKKTTDAKLICDFIQTAVRKKAKANDLTEKLSTARTQFESALKEITTEKPGACQIFRDLIEMTKGSLSPQDLIDQNPSIASDRAKFIAGMTEMRSRYAEHPDEIANFEAMVNFCVKKDEESFLNITRVEHEKDMRTCRVASIPFKQTFVWVGGADGGAWVTEDAPAGPCGVVQLSRFEQDKPHLWRYVARKAVTNPDGELLLGQKCTGLDQNEYLYDWKQERNPRLGCEFIEFSVF